MKLVAIAALLLVASFALALAIGCHNEPTPREPHAAYTAIVDGGIPDAPGPKGADRTPGFPGTNQN